MITKEAEAKAARKISTPVIVDRDYGNDMEYLMVLEEQLGSVLGSVLDSDDPLLIMSISKEIDMIKAYWKNKGNI